MVLDGVPYGLRQFHFHSPSEHTMAGEHAAMELHLVHWSDAGVIAVVGVMLQIGGHNRGLDPIWDHMPGEPGYPVTAADVSVDAAALLPDDRSYVSYEGSLTTPPCNEGVRWRLLVQPSPVSIDQVAAFRAIYDGNNRPVQPLNDRSFD